MTRPAPECYAQDQCCGPNAFCGVCDCYDAIWEDEKWWEHCSALTSAHRRVTILLGAPGV